MHILTLPLLLTLTTALTLPSLLHPRAPSCDYTGSNTPVFYLPTISYSSSIIYSTPAHRAVSSAEISFALINSVEYTTNLSCTAYDSGQMSDAAFFAFPYGHACEQPEGYGAVGAAQFSFLRAEGRVSVNESWSCGGNTYFGTASKILPLECEETKWQNANWTVGSLYSTDSVACKPLSAFLVAEVTRLD